MCSHFRNCGSSPPHPTPSILLWKGASKTPIVNQVVYSPGGLGGKDLCIIKITAYVVCSTAGSSSTCFTFFPPQTFAALRKKSQMKVLSLYIQGGEHRVNECLNARQRKHTKPNLQQQKRGTSLSLQYHLIPKRARLCTFSKWQCKEIFPGQHACELTLLSLLPWHHVKQEIFHFHSLFRKPTHKQSLLFLTSAECWPVLVAAGNCSPTKHLSADICTLYLTHNWHCWRSVCVLEWASGPELGEVPASRTGRSIHVQETSSLLLAGKQHI